MNTDAHQSCNRACRELSRALGKDADGQGHARNGAPDSFWSEYSVMLIANILSWSLEDYYARPAGQRDYTDAVCLRAGSDIVDPCSSQSEDNV